jgi:hypothetical protein
MKRDQEEQRSHFCCNRQEGIVSMEEILSEVEVDCVPSVSEGGALYALRAARRTFWRSGVLFTFWPLRDSASTP